MPLRTENIDLEEAQADVRETMEEVAEKQVEWQHHAKESQALLEQGERLNSQYAILEWAQEEWGVQSVTFASLSEGERTYVENFCDDHPDVAERVPFVAIGTHDAPYLNHDPDNFGHPDFDQSFEETVHALVSEVPIPFIEWAESAIGDLSHLGEDAGNAYFELVQEKQRETSDSEAGQTSDELPPSHRDTLLTE